MSYRIISEETYKGWVIRKISYYHYGPGSATPTYYYIASRYGVSLNTNSLEGIKRMVDINNGITTQKKCSWGEE
jgi:hypothetical protein